MVPTISQKRGSRRPEVELLYSEAARDLANLQPAAERKSWSQVRRLATELKGRLGHIRSLDDTRKTELHTTLERTEAARTQLQGVQSHSRQAREKTDIIRAENCELRRRLESDAREFVSLLKSCSSLEQRLAAIENGEEDEQARDEIACEQPADQLANSRHSSNDLAPCPDALDAEKDLLAALMDARERLMKSSISLDNLGSAKCASPASDLEETGAAHTFSEVIATAAIPSSSSFPTSANDCLHDVCDHANARMTNGDGEYSSDKSTVDSATVRAEHTRSCAVDSSATSSSATIPVSPLRGAGRGRTSVFYGQEPWDSPGPKPMAAAEEEAERIVQARECASASCGSMQQHIFAHELPEEQQWIQHSQPELWHSEFAPSHFSRPDGAGTPEPPSHPIFSERSDQVRVATSSVRRMSSSPETRGSTTVRTFLNCDGINVSHRTASPVPGGAAAALSRVTRRMSAPGGLTVVRSPSSNHQEASIPLRAQRHSHFVEPVSAGQSVMTTLSSPHVMQSKVHSPQQLTRQRTLSPGRLVAPVQIALARRLSHSPVQTARPTSYASLPRMSSPVRAESPTRLVCSPSAPSYVRTASPRLVPPAQTVATSPRCLYACSSPGSSTAPSAQTILVASQVKPAGPAYRVPQMRQWYGNVSPVVEARGHTHRGLSSRAVLAGRSTAVTCRSLSPQLPRGGPCHRTGGFSLSKVGIADPHLETHSGRVSSLASSTSGLIDC